MGDTDLSDELRVLREALDEHLDAVNQNTAEVSTVHEYAGELDLRLEKLAERVDALQALVLAQSGPKKSVRLTPKEREVYAVVRDGGVPLTSEDIGRAIGMTSDVVAQVLHCIKQKGLPVLARTVDDSTYYALDRARLDAEQVIVK